MGLGQGKWRLEGVRAGGMEVGRGQGRENGGWNGVSSDWMRERGWASWDGDSKETLKMDLKLKQNFKK